jgi:hypothetical protein
VSPEQNPPLLIDTWQWKLPQVTGHQGTSVGVALAPDTAPRLSTRWEDLAEDGADIEVWAMCSCGWGGLRGPFTAQLVRDAGRAQLEELTLLREQWEQHAREEHAAAAPNNDAELRRAAELLARWRRLDAVDAILLLRSAGHMVDGALADAVAVARRAGLSWERIAEPLGVTRAAAHQRYKAIDPRRWDGTSPRCDAADLLTGDTDLCEGDQAAVRLFDRAEIPDEQERYSGGILACVHHGARLFARLRHARVYPASPGREDTPALEVYHRAQSIKTSAR